MLFASEPQSSAAPKATVTSEGELPRTTASNVAWAGELDGEEEEEELSPTGRGTTPSTSAVALSSDAMIEVPKDNVIKVDFEPLGRREREFCLRRARRPGLLFIKNWDNYPVPSTDLTLRDLKMADFNWPCPLDMTNISLNYDDAWLNKQDRHLDPTFLANVRQALKTAEPGFAFNFGDKQNETLRNAYFIVCAFYE